MVRKDSALSELVSGFLYINLERIKKREFAFEDPEAFLNQSPKLIIDEVQNAPHLLSNIQAIVDENSQRQFIITGSQNISQSLPGRVAINT